MKLAAEVMTVVVAALHAYFLVLEMFLWATPFGAKTFQRPIEEMKQTRPLAANQGLYNGFLAAGLVWAIIAPDHPARVFLLVCVVVAGLFGAITASRKILFVQAVPGAIALALTLAACGHSGGGPDAGACGAIPASESGDGTYYAADGTGACSFDASPTDLMVAAMNAPDYATAAWCGACLEVQGPNGTITVRVVDECPGCQHGDLDLSQQAFQQIAALSAGRVPITWHEVACNVTGPVEYHFKNGANAFWTAIQLRNHRYPIAKLEAQGTGGAWQTVPRLDYNYFVQASGLGAGPYTLRVTDSRGQVLADSGIALGDNVTRDGTAQFAACP
jgi:expansin (peptidoglycan-binding protein)